MPEDRLARVRTRTRPCPHRAAANRLLAQACDTIVAAEFGRRRLLYAFAGALGLFGRLGALDLNEVGARLLEALHESGWPGPNSGPRRGSPRATIEVAFRWAQQSDPARLARALYPAPGDQP
jgi:hypothetical protein